MFAIDVKQIIINPKLNYPLNIVPLIYLYYYKRCQLSFSCLHDVNQ